MYTVLDVLSQHRSYWKVSMRSTNPLHTEMKIEQWPTCTGTCQNNKDIFVAQARGQKICSMYSNIVDGLYFLVNILFSSIGYRENKPFLIRAPMRPRELKCVQGILLW